MRILRRKIRNWKIAFLKNYDWKQYVNQKLSEVNEEISSIEFGKNAGALSGKEVENQLSIAKLSKEILEYRLENEVPIDGSTLSRTLDAYIMSYQEYLSYAPDNKLSRSELLNKKRAEEEYYLNKYRFEKGFYKDKKSFEASTEKAVSLNDIFTEDTFALFFLILVGGTIIAEEFNKGTIKQLLLKPYSRTKIFTSKVIACLLSFVVFMFIYSLAVVIINAIVYGDIKTLFEPMIFYDFAKGKVIEHSVLFACLESLVCVLPMYLIMLGASLLLGVLTTNTAVSIMVPVMFHAFYQLIHFLARGAKWLAYLPTMCWNLTEYLHGGIPEYQYSKFSISIIVDVITLVLIYGLAYFIFKKKDIKNQ